MPVGTVSCHWATHTRNGKGKRKRKKKPEETEKNPREGGGQKALILPTMSAPQPQAVLTAHW